MAVVGVAETGEEAIRLMEQLKPDLMLVDIDLGPESGFDLARRLARPRGGVAPPTILVSTHDAADFADLIAASPAIGFLCKSDLSARAIQAQLSTRIRAELAIDVLVMVFGPIG